MWTISPWYSCETEKLSVGCAWALAATASRSATARNEERIDDNSMPAQAVAPGRTLSPEQSVLCSVSSHFAERDSVRPGDTAGPSLLCVLRDLRVLVFVLVNIRQEPREQPD